MPRAADPDPAPHPHTAKRRNKWICALKSILGELKIYGPSGDPSPPPAVSRYAKVPWEIIDAEDRKKSQNAAHAVAPGHQPLDGWNLTDKNAAIRKSYALYDNMPLAVLIYPANSR